MRLIAVLLGVLTVAGCGSLVGAQSSCSASIQSYLGMWDCIRGRVSQGSAGLMNNAQGVRYLAVGDALAEQVRAGKVSDVEAKALLAIEMERGETAFNRERRADAPVTCNSIYSNVICN
jgi:hypothetical protein